MHALLTNTQLWHSSGIQFKPQLLVWTKLMCCDPCFRFNFAAGSNLILAGTIQFAASIQLAKQQLAAEFPSLVIPQSKPLSPGLSSGSMIV